MIRSVVTLDLDPAAFCSAHEHATRTHFARRLAALTRCSFAGSYNPRLPYETPPYFVPSDTVTDPGLARAMGITGVHDLFGGVVPHAFIATKAITHALARTDALRPDGWSVGFASEAADATLTGFSCFTRDEARTAGRMLLESGVVRVKPVNASGGRGQVVVTNADALDRCIDAMDEAEIEIHGVVLEENLERPQTFSIGQIILERRIVSYYGRQRLTQDNAGEMVYGGSDLMLVRGDFDELLATDGLTAPLRHAIEQARGYHGAVIHHYPGFFSSRVNYDVAQGTNSRGMWRSGVLEQSWRVGGATGAEIAALESFDSHPERKRVRSSCFELYGPASVPGDSIVSYQGVDDQVGRITKYTLLFPHADTP